MGTTAAGLRFSASTLAGGNGADTIRLSTFSAGTQVLGGAGHDSIALVTAGGGVGGASVNGGAGNDTINVVTTLGACWFDDGLHTINGGAGSDVIVFDTLSGSTVHPGHTVSGNCLPRLHHC